MDAKQRIYFNKLIFESKGRISVTYRNQSKGDDYYQRKLDTAQSYRDFISAQEWRYFGTVTFRKPRRDPIYNREQVWNVLRGHFALKSAFLISEPHTTGFLHYHGLFRGFAGSKSMDSDRSNEIEQFSSSVFGFSNFSLVRNMQEVSGYCAKYLTKGFDSGRSQVDWGFMGDWRG